nr:Vma5 [Starmerella bombicola]
MTSLFLLSLPTKAVPGTMGEPETRLKNWIEQNVGAAHGVSSIALPDLKTGMLDNLVQQAEEVAKVDGQLQNVLFKCHESIVQLMEGDLKRIEAAEQVDGRPDWAYLQQFGWNTAKYRPDRSIATILSSLSQEALSADTDLKSRLASYQATRQQLASIDRKFSGDLSVRALNSVVRRSDLVQNSDFLESILVAVPLKQEDDFLARYETLAQMVVPRSARKISADASFVLYSVTVFRKYAKELETKLREAKCVPRERPDEDANAENAAQQKKDEADIRASERRQRSEVERLAAVTFSDIIKAWGHVKIIRVFVESVLRYGLPTSYVTASFVPNGSPEKAEARLLSEFAFLGGNAVGKDSKGKYKDDGDLAEYAALVEQDYRPFAIYVSKLP